MKGRKSKWIPWAASLAQIDIVTPLGSELLGSQPLRSKLEEGGMWQRKAESTPRLEGPHPQNERNQDQLRGGMLEPSGGETRFALAARIRSW